MVWPQGAKHGLDAGSLGALAGRDFGHLELEFVKAEQRLDLFILRDAVGELRRHEDLVGAVMLELCDGIAYGTGVSVRLGGVRAHAHDAIETLKANDLTRLFEIGGEAL